MIGNELSDVERDRIDAEVMRFRFELDPIVYTRRDTVAMVTLFAVEALVVLALVAYTLAY